MSIDFIQDLQQGFFGEWLFTFLFRVTLASLLGGIIGVERTLRQKDAGFRTHIIVAMGAALVMIISKYGFFDVIDAGFGESVRVDISRVASNVITGVSFIGAGMIFANGSNIRGLTTAAGIWLTAAVGMAIGAGMYTVGLVATAVVILVQILFHIFPIGFDKITATETSEEMIVRLVSSPEAVTHLRERLQALSVQVAKMRITAESDSYVLFLAVKTEKTTDLAAVAAALSTEADVLSVAV